MRHGNGVSIRDIKCRSIAKPIGLLGIAGSDKCRSAASFDYFPEKKRYCKPTLFELVLYICGYREIVQPQFLGKENTVSDRAGKGIPRNPRIPNNSVKYLEVYEEKYY